ncbi:MAG: Rha family transcriptional regulator [Candidatus Brocadiae bacterium]|nr:Rha family transcriptional regulator [Candidatus Brocadiia bacterium]
MEKVLTKFLEIYTSTLEGFPLWKSKDLQLTYENLLDNVFILSSDLADFFNIRHAHLTGQNISKLQKEGHLVYHLPKFRRMIEVGKTAKRYQTVYALTRHQTEILIMDFAGPKAREKKITILKRLQSIEVDILKGDYLSARQKAQAWDEVP